MPTDPLPRAIGRVVLRRLELADLFRFQAYRHDPDVGRYQGWEPTPDHVATRFIEEMSKAELFSRGAWFQLGVANGSTNELIGDVGVCVGVEWTTRRPRSASHLPAMRKVLASAPRPYAG